MNEAAFHRYINLRIVYGYTFEQAVTLFLNDDYFTQEQKEAVWVNNARNRILMETALQETLDNNKRIYESLLGSGSSNSASE